MKAKVKAPANIAFIKYWGKTDVETRVPVNNSISMCLSEMFSICEVEFDVKFKKDEIEFSGEKIVKKKEIERIVMVLERIRKLANIDLKARVKTRNNFPKATGIASSASGLASVTMAAAMAAGLKLTESELSRLARRASGTASRSIPDGFVEWMAGKSEKSSYAKQIFKPDWWKICDVVAVVTTKMKKVSSTDGHKLADTSPFYKQRLKGMNKKIKAIKKLMLSRDFAQFGRLIEDEALNMHAICLTSNPPIIYWNKTTIEIMHKVREWRETGDLNSYFTIDAGPSVHVICKEKDAKEVKSKLLGIEGVLEVVINKPSVGARLLA